MKKVFSIHLDLLAEDRIKKLASRAGEPVERVCAALFRTGLAALSSGGEGPVHEWLEVSDIQKARRSERYTCSSSAEGSASLHGLLAMIAQEFHSGPQVDDNTLYAILVEKGLEIEAPSEDVVSKANLLPTVKALLPGVEFNPEQQQVFSVLDASEFDDPMSRMVHCVEMPTGSGKTLLSIGLATTAASKRKRVWVAMPTLILQKQFFASMKRFGASFSACCISGRPEFVSSQRLLELLAFCKPEMGAWYGQAFEWLENRANKPIGLDKRTFLMESFLESVDGFPFPAHDFCLTAYCSKDDEGTMSYEGQFLSANRCEVVVLTHAYLAIEAFARNAAIATHMKDNTDLAQQLRLHTSMRAHMKGVASPQEWAEHTKAHTEILSRMIAVKEFGRLNYPDVLVVDESHMLANSFDSASTQTVSLFVLEKALQSLQSRKLLKAGGHSASALVKDISKAIMSLARFSVRKEGDNGFFLNTPPTEQEFHSTMGVLQELHESLKALDPIGDGLDQQTVRGAKSCFAKAIRTSMQPSSAAIARFTNSPVYGYPRLAYSKGYIEQDIRVMLMGSQIKKTFLLSATQYLPTASGAWSTQELARSLGLQAGEMQGIRVPPSSWATDCVTLYRPRLQANGFPAIVPSNEDDGWLDPLSTDLKWVHGSAAGGVLVLMTSYQSADKIKKLIIAKGVDPSYVLICKPGVALSTLTRQFTELRLLGHKPMLIGVGAAWTGLNLMHEGAAPNEINLLTDLVIPRMPFSMAPTLSDMKNRSDARFFFQSLTSVGRYLKQGIGRLIRQPNLPSNRRIFIMDGRYHLNEHKALRNLVDLILKDYHRLGSWPGEQQASPALTTAAAQGPRIVVDTVAGAADFDSI